MEEFHIQCGMSIQGKCVQFRPHSGITFCLLVGLDEVDLNELLWEEEKWFSQELLASFHLSSL